MIDMGRYVRQVILSDVGEQGQARLGAATAAVDGEGLAHEIASRYAERAGFGAVSPGPVDVKALAPESILVDGASREVVAGARAALAEMRRALWGEGVGTESLPALTRHQ